MPLDPPQKALAAHPPLHFVFELPDGLSHHSLGVKTNTHIRDQKIHSGGVSTENATMKIT